MSISTKSRLANAPCLATFKATNSSSSCSAWAANTSAVLPEPTCWCTRYTDAKSGAAIPRARPLIEISSATEGSSHLRHHRIGLPSPCSCFSPSSSAPSGGTQPGEQMPTPKLTSSTHWKMPPPRRGQVMMGSSKLGTGAAVNTRMASARESNLRSIQSVTDVSLSGCPKGQPATRDGRCGGCAERKWHGCRDTEKDPDMATCDPEGAPPLSG
mmetsp:Transcript_24067/g.54874  ORF Transcript_24067/g.54874 Transcript_24067/m.54874 type:complete len:213 (-) Transcript_24067:30-668(-)